VNVPTDAATLAALDRFSAAFDAHDLDALMACITDDCVFESTRPPDGERFEGRAAVRQAWADIFADSPGAQFTAEDQFVSGDRAVVLWRYDWSGDHPGHVRGVDVMTVRGGLVAAKRSYVKG
jgi:ketosteroid isomerase-like protein